MYNSEKPEPKEFLESLRYYQRAALIDPQSGNPHNQVPIRCSALFLAIYVNV